MSVSERKTNLPVIQYDVATFATASRKHWAARRRNNGHALLHKNALNERPFSSRLICTRREERSQTLCTIEGKSVLSGRTHGQLPQRQHRFVEMTPRREAEKRRLCGLGAVMDTAFILPFLLSRAEKRAGFELWYGTGMIGQIGRGANESWLTPLLEC